MKNKIFLLLVFLIIPAIACAEDIEINPLLIKTSTKVGVAAEEFVKIANVGVSTLAIKITTKNPDFKLSNYGFGLLPEREKELKFAFSSGTPGVFINEFFIRSDTSTFVLPIIIEVESSNARFDSTVETLNAKRVFYPGEELMFSFTVFDLLDFVGTDVNMKYSVISIENDLVYDDESTVNVKSQKTLTRKVKLPQDLKQGAYVLVLSTNYGSDVSFSTLLFNVVEEPVAVKFFSFKEFFLSLITSCLSRSVCIGIIISVALILFAVLLIYIIEVVKLSRLPKKKIEKAMNYEKKRKKKLNLAKRVLKEAEEWKKTKKQERLEEAGRKKIIEQMLTKQRKNKPTIAEKKLFEREIKKSIKNRKGLIKQKKEELKRKKKIEKMLKNKK